MTKKALDPFMFSELLCARFCHDLSGPIGALNNGIEFLVDDANPEMRKQALDLLNLSASEAFARLRLFRVAYGVVNYGGEASVMELCGIAEDFFKHGHVAFAWQNIEKMQNVTLSSYIRQVIANMIVITAGVLAYGGKMTVMMQKSDSGGKVIRVVAEHERLRQDPELSKILKGGGDASEANARNVQAYFLYNLAKKLKIGLTFEESQSRVECIASYAK